MLLHVAHSLVHIVDSLYSHITICLFTYYWTFSLFISLLTLQNKITQIGWLKQYNFMFSQFCNSAVQDKGAGSLSFFWGLSAWSAGWLPYYCVLTRPFFCACASLGTVSSCRGTVIFDYIPILMISFSLNYLHKGPVSKYSHPRMLGLQHMHFEGTQFSL